MVLLPIEINVTLSGLQATHKPTLLLPQSFCRRQTSTAAAAMKFKQKNSNKGTAAHRGICNIFYASGDSQIHTLTPAELPSPADIHRCRNGILKKTVTRVLQTIEIHVTLCGLQATYKSTLLLPQSCLVVVSLQGSVWDSGTSPADLHWCSNDI